MSWRNSLQKAKFKNIAFEVTSHSLAAGRRGQMHEYANRDTPYFEDLGRKARSFTLEAFVIGDDYHTRRDALIATCEQPGVGKLVHPYLGSLQVVNTACELTESFDNGRIAKFSLTFVEAGDIAFPTATIDKKAGIGFAATALKSVASGSFLANYEIKGLPEFVVQSNKSTLSNWLGSFSGNISTDTITKTLQDATEALPDLIKEADTIVNTVQAVSSSIREGGHLEALKAATSFATNTVLIPTGTQTRAREILNIKAIDTLIQATTLADEATLLAEKRYNSYQDAIGAALDFAGRIDGKLLTDVVQSDNDLTSSLLDVSSKVVNYVRDEASKLARLTTTSMPDPVPALVLAYDLYEDAARDIEIQDRNGIIHPSFLPPATDLEVLSR
ncbi:MAG: DNA circularization N-terminal domain-containing protein [Sneathiella sp.]